MDKRIPTEEERRRAAFPTYAVEWNAPDGAHREAYLTVTRDAEVILTDEGGRGPRYLAGQAVEVIRRAHESITEVRWEPAETGWVAALVMDPGV